jgi:hypothetical protein
MKRQSIHDPVDDLALGAKRDFEKAKILRGHDGDSSALRRVVIRRKEFARVDRRGGTEQARPRAGQSTP